MKRSLPLLLIVAVLVAALLLAWYLKRSTAEITGVLPSRETTPANRDGGVKLGSEPPHALGDTGAPVMLEEFGDFQCQPCGLLHPVLKNLKAEFGPNLVIVFREFPLVAKHPNALPAARAAEAAGLQGKFWQMHDLLYENQMRWRDASEVQSIFAEYASRIGLAPDQFKRDSLGETVGQRIALDRERGVWVGVTGTPTVFLNGREVTLESLAADKLRPLINAQIKPEEPK